VDDDLVWTSRPFAETARSVSRPPAAWHKSCRNRSQLCRPNGRPTI